MVNIQYGTTVHEHVSIYRNHKTATKSSRGGVYSPNGEHICGLFYSTLRFLSTLHCFGFNSIEILTTDMNKHSLTTQQEELILATGSSVTFFLWEVHHASLHGRGDWQPCYKLLSLVASPHRQSYSTTKGDELSIFCREKVSSKEASQPGL